MLLAQSGLLNGRRATTHWKLLDAMQSAFPAVRVEGGPLYIQDGPIWTSGGVSSGFDLTLAWWKKITALASPAISPRIW